MLHTLKQIAWGGSARPTEIQNLLFLATRSAMRNIDKDNGKFPYVLIYDNGREKRN